MTAPTIPPDVAALIERFDEAAQIYGHEYIEDCVGPSVDEARIEYDAAKEAIASALAALQAEVERLRNALTRERHEAMVAGMERRHAIAARDETIRELRKALAPFISIRDGVHNKTALISKKLSGLTPITITVTKDQFLHALKAAALNSTEPTDA